MKVTPGAHNLGIFINIKSRDNEEYQLTHPTAHLGGMLRGSLSVTVADTCFVTCAKSKMKAILHYQEESWLGKTQNKINGVIYSYDPENDNRSRLKEIPEKDVLGRVEGCWHDQVNYTLSGSRVSDDLYKAMAVADTKRNHTPLSTYNRSSLSPKSYLHSTNSSRTSRSAFGPV